MEIEIRIRVATRRDVEGLHRIYFSAFPEGERKLVSKLALDLLTEQSTRPNLSLVAEANHEIIGHVAFSPVTFEGMDNVHGCILAPLAIQPDYQKCGIGSKLIRFGKDRLIENGVRVLLVYGDPKYYGRFGFSAKFAESFVPPYQLRYPFGWQGMAMSDFDPPSPPISFHCVSALQDPDLW